MKEWKTKSLAQIVTSDPRTANVLEKYHLDFCCKGKRTLQQACDESGYPAELVSAELDSATQTSRQDDLDFRSMPLVQLIKYIVNVHHAYVKKELPAIMGYLQRVASKHGEAHPEMLKVFSLFAEIKEEMELHMQKEELILFPRIAEIEKWSNAGPVMGIMPNYLESPIQIMEEEHDQAGKIMEEIRALTDNYTPPTGACTTYRLSLAALQAFEMDLHRHVHLENHILFPAAVQLLQFPESSFN